MRNKIDKIFDFIVEVMHKNRFFLRLLEVFVGIFVFLVLLPIAFILNIIVSIMDFFISIFGKQDHL